MGEGRPRVAGRSPTSHTLALVRESANRCGVTRRPDPLSPCWCSPHTQDTSSLDFLSLTSVSLPGLHQSNSPHPLYLLHSPVSRTSPWEIYFKDAPLKGRMDTCKCMAESLCYPPETTTT